MRHGQHCAERASAQLDYSIGHLVRQTTDGVVEALATAGGDPLGTMWGIGYGSVRGAVEAGLDPRDVAAHAIQSARGVAKDIGLTETEAAEQAARGAIEAADSLGPEAAGRVREGVVNDLLGGAPSVQPVPEHEA